MRVHEYTCRVLELMVKGGDAERCNHNELYNFQTGSQGAIDYDDDG